MTVHVGNQFVVGLMPGVGDESGGLIDAGQPGQHQAALVFFRGVVFGDIGQGDGVGTGGQFLDTQFQAVLPVLDAADDTDTQLGAVGGHIVTDADQFTHLYLLRVLAVFQVTQQAITAGTFVDAFTGQRGVGI